MNEDFSVGDPVEKTSGDYKFTGIVVAVFHKLNNKEAVRVVVENSDGVLHIFSPKQLQYDYSKQAAKWAKLGICERID